MSRRATARITWARIAHRWRQFRATPRGCDVALVIGLCSGASFSSRPQPSSGQPATPRISRPPFRSPNACHSRGRPAPPAPAPVAQEAAPSPPLPAAAAAILSASDFAPTATAQSYQPPTHAELVQHWAARCNLARLIASRRSVLTRSPGLRGINDGATTTHSCPAPLSWR